MNPAFALGPVLLPWGFVLLLTSLLLAWSLGRWLGTRHGVDVERPLWRAFWVGVLLARFAFVYEFRSAYLSAPLSILDIRDGGWNPMFGVIGAWLYAFSYRHKDMPAWPALRGTLAASTALFVVGIGVLTFLPNTGRPLPALTVQSLQGQAVALQTFQGRPTVVNLWATWCPPCVREMPVFQAAQQQSPDVNFVFLNQGEAAAKVEPWLRARGLQLDNVLIDETRTAGAALQQQAFPTTLFFDADGRLVSTRIGELSAATLDARLENIRRAR